MTRPWLWPIGWWRWRKHPEWSNALRRARQRPKCCAGGGYDCTVLGPRRCCDLPPDGWWCSRKPGHDGPCAARMVGGDDR